jgi:hypothetical protein
MKSPFRIAYNEKENGKRHRTVSYISKSLFDD